MSRVFRNDSDNDFRAIMGCEADEQGVIANRVEKLLTFPADGSPTT